MGRVKRRGCFHPELMRKDGGKKHEDEDRLRWRGLMCVAAYLWSQVKVD